MAIDKGREASCEASSESAMYSLGYYYQYYETNYALAKKYYFQAIDNGRTSFSTEAMERLGDYYQTVEKDYALMKKYYIIAIDKGSSEAMDNLINYYLCIEKNYGLAEKYYIMAIIQKYDIGIIINLTTEYLNNNIVTNNLLYNYLLEIIKKYPDYPLNNLGLLEYGICPELRYTILESFCKIIDNEFLSITNFEYCVEKIIDFINYPYNYIYQFGLKSECVNYCMKYISKLYYNKNKEILKNKLDFNTKESQLFMEYLDNRYYKNLEIKYAPGGEECMKTKKHFYSIANINKKYNTII
jgi:hypothetical protein